MATMTSNEQDVFLEKAMAFKKALENLPWAYEPTVGIRNLIREIGQTCDEYERYLQNGVR